MLYLFLFLKLPIIAACWIVWWAVHQDGDEVEQGGDGGGGRRVHPHHPHPRRPRPPRRGPHAEPPPRAPARTRQLRGRTLEPRH
jgi:hypothetical protein